MKLTTSFISKTKHIYVKTLTVLKSQFEIKAMLLWIKNFPYVSSYLQTKIFARKQNCEISSRFKKTKTLIKIIL